MTNSYLWNWNHSN